VCVCVREREREITWVAGNKKLVVTDNKVGEIRLVKPYFRVHSI